MKTGKFDIVLTSFEIACREKATFKKIEWKYFVIDEAHRIKNEDSLLSKVPFCACTSQRSLCRQGTVKQIASENVGERVRRKDTRMRARTRMQYVDVDT